MSLFVVLKSKNRHAGEQNYLERHIPFHNGSMPTLVNEEIDYIQADCDELDEIRRIFAGTIPDSFRRVVRWYGDIAKTIYYNIR